MTRIGQLNREMKAKTCLELTFICLGSWVLERLLLEVE